MKVTKAAKGRAIAERAKRKYSILNGILSAIFLIAVYHLYLKTIPDVLDMFLLTFLWIFISSTLGSIVARIITRYWSDFFWKEGKVYLRTPIMYLFFTVLIILGFYTFLFSGAVEWYYAILIWAVIKITLFTSADWLADEIGGY